MKRITLFFLLLVLCLTMLAACSNGGPDQTAPSSEPPASSAPVEPSSDPAQSSGAVESVPVSEVVSTPEPQPSQEQGGTYTFGQSVPESEEVEESWFEDAVFLGDSRIEGLQLYSGRETFSGIRG